MKQSKGKKSEPGDPSEKRGGMVANILGGASRSANVRIMFQGSDATPQSLFSGKKVSTEIDAVDIPKIGVNFAPSVVGKAPSKVSMAASAGTQDSMFGDFGESKGDMTKLLDGLKLKEMIAEQANDEDEVENKAEFTEEDLNAFVEITLEETNTSTIFNIQGVCVGKDYPEHKAVTDANEAYDAMLAARSGSDFFVDRHSQTINFDRKHKCIEAAPVPGKEISVQATAWVIYDEQRKSAASSAANVPESTRVGAKKEKVTTSFERTVDSIVSKYLLNPDCLLDVEAEESKDVRASSCKGCAADNENDDEEAHVAARRAEEILQSGELVESLCIVERCVQQNVYHESHLKYRGKEAAAAQHRHAAEEAGKDKEQDPDEDNNSDDDDVQGENAEKEASSADTEEELRMAEASRRLPSMEKLWDFKCDLTEGRTVTCLSWSKQNPDLLAVGYGCFHVPLEKSDDGLILLWTLKNPEYPEKVIRVDTGICSLDFSATHPSLLAAGCNNGSVAIYNLQKDSGNPVLDSSKVSAQHKDSVWMVKWVQRKEKGETLVSISTDGRVKEWSMKKGLAPIDLMALKRVNIPNKFGGTSEQGIISRSASGLCLDFPEGEQSVYFAGTEDGTIHKCSCSYNEQYLSTHYGHCGPVYKVRTSPFVPSCFVSCSADWTVKLWDQADESPALSLQAVGQCNEVYDVAWSPSASTVFASVTAGNRVEVWDIAKNTLNPVVATTLESEVLEPIEMSALPETITAENVLSSILGAENEDQEAKDESGEKEKRFVSSVEFASHAPILVVGNSAGAVHTYLLKNIGTVDDDDGAQLRRVLNPDDGMKRK